jgi:site-specific DNA-methyltransferase (adenine-specific)
LTAWLDADVLVTDPPYGTDGGFGYGRRSVHNKTGGSHGLRIAGDLDTTLRDRILSDWGNGATVCFGSPRTPEPPGRWDYRLVWDRVEPGMNSGAWRYTHENIFVRGDGWVRISASAYSVLRFPRSGGMGNDERTEHPHRKPAGLMARLIAAAPSGVITDPFAGTGTTLVAAKHTGRRAIGVELEERYCEIAAQRLAQDTLFGGVA